MRLNVVLDHDERGAVLDAVERLGTVRRLTAHGVQQFGAEVRQFVVAIDEDAQRWSVVYDDGLRFEYRDGVATLGSDPPHAARFEQPMPTLVRMLRPALLPFWGGRSSSFDPLLMQHVGDRSMLITFEHKDDPALRQTLVIDRTNGVATKLVGLNEIVIMTAVEPLGEWRAAPTLEPIADWIRPHY